MRTLDHSLTTAEDQQARTGSPSSSARREAGTLPRRVAGIGDDSLAQVVDADGRVLASSPNIEGRPAIASVAAVGTTPTARTMRGLPDDREVEDYRVWSARTDTTAGPVAVFVGPSLEASQEAIGRLVSSLAVGLPPLVALLALAIWVAVGRALRPVEQVRREVAVLGARSLERRVPVPATGDEVARLATTMNQMLDRLETADRRQREFVGNASHDLQSPLTVLRTELEVTLAGGDLEEWRRTGRRLLHETDRMEALVADLLFLARVEETAGPSPVPLDLEDLVSEEVTRLARDPGLEVRLTATGAPVRGQPRLLARMVRNLLLNAGGFARQPCGGARGRGRRRGGAHGRRRRARRARGAARARVRPVRHPRRGPRAGWRHRPRSGDRPVGRRVARRDAGTEGPGPTSRFVVRLPRL